MKALLPWFLVVIALVVIAARSRDPWVFALAVGLLVVVLVW